MTLVVTHANGFLGCFTRNDDGTMRQRALIDTGGEPPTALELANIGERLAGEYGWTIVVDIRKPRTKAKALPSAAKPTAVEIKRLKDAERKRRERNATKKRDTNDIPDIEQRKTMIVDYLRDHPDSTIDEILIGNGLEAYPQRKARWHHQFAALMQANMIVRQLRENHPGPGNPQQYRLVDHNSDA